MLWINAAAALPTGVPPLLGADKRGELDNGKSNQQRRSRVICRTCVGYPWEIQGNLEKSKLIKKTWKFKEV